MSGTAHDHDAGVRARVPDLMLEKLALDELPPAEATALRQRLGAEEQARLVALARSNEEILREHPPAAVAAAVRQRLARLDEAEPRRTSATWLAWAPVLTAAAVALVWWVSRDGTPTIDGPQQAPPVIAKAEPDHPPTQQDPETIYLKGDPRLTIDRIADGRPQRLSAGNRIAAGDVLQVGYLANGVQQGVVVSIDGAGVATLHFPSSEDGSARLEQGGRVGLRESYELDAAPGFERFFFVTVAGTEPTLEPARVMEAARALAKGEHPADGALVLPQGYAQQSILLEK